jgi:cytochrome c551/c552
MYRDLLKAIAESFERIADNYAGHEGEVATLIEQCQEAIEDAREGALGPWEKRELDYARTAQRAGWLRLALAAAEKALLVSQLPPDEYAYGASYSQPSV